eukprot:gene26282-29500_t
MTAIFSVFLLTLVTPTAAANGTTTMSEGVPIIQVDTSTVAAAAVWTDTTIPVERETMVAVHMSPKKKPTIRSTTSTRASFFVTGAVPCEGATTFQNEMPATSMPRDSITDTSDAGSPPAFPRMVDAINATASPAGEGCHGGNVMKQQAGKGIAPLREEGCDDGNAMQPGTAPITDDVSPALEISRLSSDRDECLAVALHSASLLFRNCVYPLRAAQERIATASSETTTFESVARLKVKSNPFANVLLQRKLLGSGPSFLDSSNCCSTAETRDASARRQAPKPEP